MRRSLRGSKQTLWSETFRYQYGGTARPPMSRNEGGDGDGTQVIDQATTGHHDHERNDYRIHDHRVRHHPIQTTRSQSSSGAGQLGTTTHPAGSSAASTAASSDSASVLAGTGAITAFANANRLDCNTTQMVMASGHTRYR